MERQIKDREAYKKVITAFRRRREGATAADITAQTALPLHQVRELIPLAADEYSARLEVTDSGEILYSFPRGFASKYRGFRAGLGRFAEKFLHGAKIAGTALFKVWIMVMLVGYFAFFMLIAIAALVLSMAVSVSGSNSRSSDRRGGGMGGLYIGSYIFNLIIRLWFYSTLTQSMYPRSGYYGGREPAKPKGRPLHKAIFSFVFGDGDPNADWAEREKKAVIAYITANRGVISLPEFMVLTGNSPAEAQERITAYCVEFGGLPEATGDGTVAYRFDELLLRADRQDRSFPGFSAPLKRLLSFSSNPGNMNRWFGVINAVNLAFGGYFLFNALNSGALLTEGAFKTASYLYAVTYLLFSEIIHIGNPLPFITIGMGIIPIAFSALFWLIPGLRFLGLDKANEAVKLENFRKDGYGRIWDKPKEVQPGSFNPQASECRPRNMDRARDRIIKEMGAYAIPEVDINAAGETVYAFGELEREKTALEKYRASVDPAASRLGKTVFDSEN